jgi:uncharacterized glyoxalase superfamily protein PhnB
MDFESYKKAYFLDPEPKPRFDFLGLHGIALFFENYESAVAYYTQVLGPPGYVEGGSTKGWKIGNTWLTLFPSKSDSPQNTEIHILMNTPAEADKFHEALIRAGGTGEKPSDQLMYEPLRFCPVQDPFGTRLLIVSRLPQKDQA